MVARTRLLRFHLALSAPSHRPRSPSITGGDAVAIRRRSLRTQDHGDVHLWHDGDIDMSMDARNKLSEEEEEAFSTRPWWRNRTGSTSTCPAAATCSCSSTAWSGDPRAKPQSSRSSCGRQRVRSLSQGAGCDATRRAQSVHRWECGLPPGQEVP